MTAISQQCGLHGCTRNHYAWTDKHDNLHNLHVYFGRQPCSKAQPQPMSTSIPNYVSIFYDGSPSWCYTLMQNYNFACSIKPWEMGFNKGKHGGITPHNIRAAQHFLKCVLKWYPTKYVSPSVFSNAPLTAWNWVFSIFFASLTLKWLSCDLDMTLLLSTSKAQLFLMLLFAHKLGSCWCLNTNLT